MVSPHSNRQRRRGSGSMIGEKDFPQLIEGERNFCGVGKNFM
jgi:hypothetical protein